MAYWKYKKGSSVKKLSTTGLKRKVGVKNYTDKTAKRLKRKRVAGYVNTTDKAKRASYRRRSRAAFSLSL